MFGQEKQRVTTMTRASSGCEQVDRDNKTNRLTKMLCRLWAVGQCGFIVEY